MTLASTLINWVGWFGTLWVLRPGAIRVLAIWEASVRAPALPKPPAMPVDLLNAALHESEGWARESTLKRMRELYDEHGDWNLVRHHWTVGA